MFAETFNVRVRYSGMAISLQIGLVAAGFVDSAGNFVNLRAIPGFATGWTHIVPAGFGRLLFYRASDGWGGTGVVDAAGNFINLRSIPGFALNWSRITTS